MHALRVAQTIKDRVPNAEISWVARRRYVRTVEACTAIDRVFPFYRRQGIGAYFALVRSLRRQEYDFVLDMEGLARSAVMTWLSKGRIKVGRSDAREGASLFYRKMVPMPEIRRQLHPIDILLEFCRVFGEEPKLSSPVRFDFGGKREWQAGSSDRPFEIALCDLSPTTKDPFDGVDDLVAAFACSRLPCRIVLLGDERSEARDNWEVGEVEDLRGKLSLEERVQRVTRSSLVVSSPGGPLHIASACDVPVIGLFGRLNPDICGPYPVRSSDVNTVRVYKRNLSEVSNDVVKMAEKLLSR